MRKTIFSVFLFFLLFFCTNNLVNAFYEPSTVPNNIYGIHIVNFSDLNDAKNLVNSSNGDWGYVTIVVTQNDRNRQAWQDFFDNCRRNHLIPIVRIASKLEGQNWVVPKVEDIDSWVNFLNSLNWVIENRYVIIGNEPNHSTEWGGKINPEEYGIYLKTFSERLKNSNKDYFVLAAGLDQAAPNSIKTMDERLFLTRMVKVIPNFEDVIDGLDSHSYPNPAFSGSQFATGRKSIRGYEWELSLFKSFGVKKDLPVFITETGWVRNSKNENLISEKMKFVYKNVWEKDKRIVAVTPFVLNYTEDLFYEFSWKNKNGDFFKLYDEIKNLEKVKGSPIQKIDGEILFSFLNPFGIANTTKRGYTLVENTGQNIFDKYNIKVLDENNLFNIAGVSLQNLEPFNNGLVIYTIKMPENKGTYQIKLGMYVNDKKIGDVYEGKIISW